MICPHGAMVPQVVQLRPGPENVKLKIFACVAQFWSCRDGVKAHHSNHTFLEMSSWHIKDFL